MTGALPPRMTRAVPAGSWRIMSGVATGWRAAVVLAADLPRGVAAQGAGRLQGGGVGDAGQERLDRGGVQDDLAAVVAPAAGELGLAVHDGDDLDALAAGVRQPGRERDRADLGDLVQAHQQRRVQPPGRRRLPGDGGGVVDLGRHRGEQRGDRGVLADRLGDQVDGARPGQEPGDVEPLARAAAARWRRARGRP